MFILRWIIKLTSFPVLFFYFRIKRYNEKLSNKTKLRKGGYILVCNHNSWIDIVALFMSNPFRVIHTWIGPLVYQHRFYRFMLKIFSSIFVSNSIGQDDYMNKSVKLLKKHKIVAIFPEGHMLHGTQIDTFKPGFIRLALISHAPIVLMYSNGKYNFKNRTRINVSQKINIRDYFTNDNPSEEEIERVCEIMRQKMVYLKNQCEYMKKYHLESKIDFYWFWIDAIKFFSAFIIPKFFIVFPTKIYYQKGASKSDRKVKDNGVIIGNHFGFTDPIIMHYFYYKRRVNIVAAEELYQSSKFFAAILNKTRCIELHRKSKQMDLNMFNNALCILKGNGVVGIYPEGHINVGENNSQTFHGGAILLALLSGSPIYPYYSNGAYKYFKKQSAIIGKPIYLTDYYSKDVPINTQLVDRLTIVLKDKMNELSVELKNQINSKHHKGGN